MGPRPMSKCFLQFDVVSGSSEVQVAVLRISPIFLIICGEGPCNGIGTDYINVFSKKFGVAVVSLEHCYYGKKFSFNSLTLENLRYLSSKQILFDLPIFRQYYQDSFNLKLNRTNVENPWVLFGVSYPGALSAWFRLKFSHLICESLASSDVVLAVCNYTEFDQHQQETTKRFEQSLATDGKAMKPLFGAAELEIDGDFFYFLADVATIGVVFILQFQYGNPGTVCSYLVKAKKNIDDLVESYAKYFGASVGTYNQEYHLDRKRNVFGEGIYLDVTTTNIYYGGTNIGGSNIYFPSYLCIYISHYKKNALRSHSKSFNNIIANKIYEILVENLLLLLDQTGNLKIERKNRILAQFKNTKKL
ncbi:hypothetical protein UlMin_013781 [Ulmus minor]